MSTEAKAIRRRLGKWSTPAVPHKGWTCEGVEDLGSPSETCEMCEAADIRYVHIMMHPSMVDELRCGCICAGLMAEDLAGAKQREAGMKAKVCRHATAIRAVARRREKWITKPWRMSAKGNPWRWEGDWRVVIVRDSLGYRFMVAYREREHWADYGYPTKEAAKGAAFDFIEEVKKTVADKRAA